MVVEEQFLDTVNKVELGPGVFLYKDVIPGYEQIVPYIEQVVSSGMVLWDKKEIGLNSLETMSFEYPTEFRDPNEQGILFDQRMSLVFAAYLGAIEKDFLTSNEIGASFSHDTIFLMKYSSEERFPISRNKDGSQLAIMYYLNDDYEGGNIDFPNLGIKYQPKANEALIFPAAEGFEYTIEKMTDGVKYSVLTYLR